MATNSLPIPDILGPSTIGNAGVIGFTARVVFWLGLVLVMLPDEDGVTVAEDALRRLLREEGGAGRLVALCTRQPDICAELAGMARDNAPAAKTPQE